MRSLTILAAGFCCIGLLAGCGSENPFDRGPDLNESVGPPPASGVSFQQNVVPSLTACVSCHAAGAGGWSYDGGGGSYSSVLETIDTSNPANSLLLVKATGGAGHGGGSIFSVTSNQYESILAWIREGAKNN